MPVEVVKLSVFLMFLTPNKIKQKCWIEIWIQKHFKRLYILYNKHTYVRSMY